MEEKWEHRLPVVPKALIRSITVVRRSACWPCGLSPMRSHQQLLPHQLLRQKINQIASGRGFAWDCMGVFPRQKCKLKGLIPNTLYFYAPHWFSSNSLMKWLEWCSHKSPSHLTQPVSQFFLCKGKGKIPHVVWLMQLISIRCPSSTLFAVGIIIWLTSCQIQKASCIGSWRILLDLLLDLCRCDFICLDYCCPLHCLLNLDPSFRWGSSEDFLREASSGLTD